MRLSVLGSERLVDQWVGLSIHLEWVCLVGIGRFYAPWHPPTRLEYDAYRSALRRRVAYLGALGVLRPERMLAMSAAMAAHGAPYPPNVGREAIRERDQALRHHFRPPESIREAVAKRVPALPWPLPRFIPPPPAP